MMNDLVCGHCGDALGIWDFEGDATGLRCHRCAFDRAVDLRDGAPEGALVDLAAAETAGSLV